MYGSSAITRRTSNPMVDFKYFVSLLVASKSLVKKSEIELMLGYENNFLFQKTWRNIRRRNLIC